ncbi:MAG: DNA mismatch repair endonuclease MutL [Caloramator sp.]|nr:DNA mismatch repair endonuclease MutL [Caloramator sp.]
MSKIKILDDDLITKIAAGEVVERPASVVKELVENSIDAGASIIEIEIENGGISLIKITDNGQGIEKDDVELAFLRHTTSKIENEDDLYNIRTLGFRGEALASICAVSKVEMITKTKDDITGTKIYIEGGEIIDKIECGAPDGTTIIVKDLFFNTPARLKFLKTPSREAMVVSEVVQSLALSNENISFKYKNNHKIVFATKGDGNLLNAIIALYGRQVKDNLLKIDFEENHIKIEGYIGNNALGKNNRSYQTLFINGRLIKNKTINAAIENVYRSFSTSDKYPLYVVKLNMNPQLVDVNVHPTKAEVKFQNDQEIYRLVYKAVQNAFATAASVPNVVLGPSIENNIERNVSPQIKSEEIKFSFNSLDKQNQDINNSNTFISYKPNVNVKEDNQKYINNDENKEKFIEDVKNFEDEEIIDNRALTLFPKLVPIGQIHLTYIIAEAENEFYIIDQHAAHERILYEKYLEEYQRTSIHSQTLLTPKIIDLKASDKEFLLENIDNFAKIGFVIEDFGGNSISLRSVPVIYGNPNYIDVFNEILNEIQQTSSGFLGSVNKIIYTMACKGAIKAGDKLTLSEMNKLIDDLRRCQNPYSCPHGRPTLIRMTYVELEKKFRRIL